MITPPMVLLNEYKQLIERVEPLIDEMAANKKMDVPEAVRDAWHDAANAVAMAKRTERKIRGEWETIK